MTHVHRSALTDEERRAIAQRLTAFGHKLKALLEEESEDSGLAGVLIGFGAGLMLGGGSSKADVRQVLETSLKQIPELTATGGSS